MKCQNLFSGKEMKNNEMKNISKCCLPKFLRSIPSFNMDLGM